MEAAGTLPITLRDLSQGYANIHDLVMADTTDEDLQAALGSLEDAILLKTEGIANIVLELRARIEALKTEQDRLARHSKHIQAREKWLCNYLERELIACNLSGWDFINFSAKVANIPSVEVFDLSLIPDHYWRTPPAPSAQVDKKAILDLWRTEQSTVPGTTIKDRRLVIK